MQKYVLCGHINLQKGDLGAIALMQCLKLSMHTNTLKKEDICAFIVGVQEPPFSNNRIRSFNRENSLFYDHFAERPRAALYASRNLDLWPMSDYTDADMASCLWKTGNNDIPEVVVSSIYMDITNDEVCSSKLKKLTRFCHNKGKELLLLCDTNAHSTLWSCTENNSRGDKMEEFIFSSNLSVCNTGNHPTFFNRRAETIIDVTLASVNLREHIQDWKVETSVTGSDHYLISFLITISINKQITIRNYDKGDWNLFQASMEVLSSHYIPNWDAKAIDAEVDKMETDII